MAYKKQNFRDGDVLFAEQLNAMDTQIEKNAQASTASAEAIETAKTEAISTSKTYTEEKVAAALTITIF